MKPKIGRSGASFWRPSSPLWGLLSALFPPGSLLTAFSSSYPFPTLSEVGTACFSSCCDKDSAII
jgi:hypothetical protein